MPFIAPEITLITSCPVYSGSASRHHRYSAGREIFADDHIYWAPLIAMHSGMRVTEIGLLQFDQLQAWYGRQTFVLEIEADQSGGIDVATGYKTGNALRRRSARDRMGKGRPRNRWSDRKAQGGPATRDKARRSAE